MLDEARPCLIVFERTPKMTGLKRALANLHPSAERKIGAWSPQSGNFFVRAEDQARVTSPVEPSPREKVTSEGSRSHGGEWHGTPYYPQSNGKLERFHLTLKDYAYKKLPLDWEDGKRIIGEMIDYYNGERLHSAIDFVTPTQCLRGERDVIVKQRKAKHLEAAKNRTAYWLEKSLEERAACAAMNGLGEAEATRAEERVA